MREGTRIITNESTSTASSIIQNGVLLASNYALSISSNVAQVNSPLVKLAQTNVGSSKSPLELQNDGTGPCLLLSGAHSQIYMKEQASADADVAAYGQLWVKTVTPNELWFTDDAGTDWRVSGNITTSWFGAWETKAPAINYLAATDGIVTAWRSGGAVTTDGYTDSNPVPTTRRCYNSDGNGAPGITMPVRKGDYWRVDTEGGAGATVYWLPVGS